MTSTPESTTQSPRPVSRVAVVTHGQLERVAEALERLRAFAASRDVEVVEADGREADMVVVLGGDGTLLRSLAGRLGTNVPVIGVNFGRVGFLASIEPARLEADLARVFAGEYRVVVLPTLAAEAGGERFVALNDVVATSGTIGRMIELEWAIGDEDLGRVACDGLICSTPSGSTAYNLSNGGPVLVRGLEASAVTFVAPHSLHARPMVVPRGAEVHVWNRTPDVDVLVIADGHAWATLGCDDHVSIRLDDERSLLATLPETTFFGRYRAVFGS
jgi:NAD+ kinase